MATPDIAIGAHADLGIVATTATGVPAAKILLSRLGFVRGEHSDLYVLLPNDPDQPGESRVARAQHAVAVLRSAHFTVDADIAYEPDGAGNDQSAEPDVAFGRHPDQGITAAITGERPYAAMVLRAAGFTYDAERDVYALPSSMRHTTASTIARNTASVLRQSGSTVHIIPGTLADPARTSRTQRVAKALDGPGGAKALLASLRRFLETAAAWCAERAGTSAVSLADSFTTAAARLDVTAQSLNQASARLRAEPDAPAENAVSEQPASNSRSTASADPRPPSDSRNAETAKAFEELAAELRTAADNRAAAEILARATSQEGPLHLLQRVVSAAATQSAKLPPQLSADLVGPLADAVTNLGRVSETLTDIGTHLADGPGVAPTPPTNARAQAARSTSPNRPKTAKAPEVPFGPQPAPRQAAAAAAPNRSR